MQAKELKGIKMRKEKLSFTTGMIVYIEKPLEYTNNSNWWMNFEKSQNTGSIYKNYGIWYTRIRELKNERICL